MDAHFFAFIKSQRDGKFIVLSEPTFNSGLISESISHSSKLILKRI